MNLPNGYCLQRGKYQISNVVGQGGFGITYKGVWFTEVKGTLGTIKTEVPVCIKEYFFKDYCYRDSSNSVQVHSETGKKLFDKFKEKLIKEAKILSDVHHPHIVNVLEVFEENETAYIAMEYIAGNSLKYMLEKKGPLPEQKVLQYISQIGEALQFVHEKSILHLDIKPSNILIDKEDNARLIDFGVSKRYDIEQQETSTTVLTLSKGFASIEQYDDEGTQVFSPCPDIYSLGATIYNLLTGKIPTESILRATRPLRSPKEINPAISQKTEDVIVKAMQIIPADRYESVREMIEALDIPVIEKKRTEIGKGMPDLESDDETTMLATSRKEVLQEDDDETIVKNRPQKEVPKRNKKRKGILISFLITIFALVGSAVTYLIYSNSKPVLPETETIVPAVEEHKSEVVSDNINRDTTSVSNGNDMTNTTPEDKVVQTGKKSEGVKPTVVDTKEKTLPTKQEEPKIDSLAIKNEIYEKLLASGKEKFSVGNYSGAKDDFTKARATKLTEEIIHLLETCNTKEKERRIALYEEKMSFGKYKIVRRKSTGLYGAIDSNGEERIPCKYINVGNANNGRAFEREDNLFDIYNNDGVLVSSGSTDY